MMHGVHQMDSDNSIVGKLKGKTDKGLEFSLSLRPKTLVRVGACRCYKVPCLCALDLVLQDASVSSQHFQLWAVIFDLQNPAVVYLKDTSMNGTFVNGNKVGHNKIFLLTDGDVISVKFGLKAMFHHTSRSNLETPYSVHDWLVHPITLGTGSFGKVLAAENKFTRRRLWAVKITDAKFTEGKVQSEARLLVKLNHPNIIKVDCVVLRKSQLYTFQELLHGGDLFSYLTNGRYLSAIPEDESRFIVYQILQAVQYLHSKGIVHRDIKPDNILRSSPEPYCRIVLADFGVATKCEKSSNLYTVAGTTEYCAPEVHDPQPEGYNSKCDIWSIGVITHIMLTGVSPFLVRHDYDSTIRKVREGMLDFRLKQWSGVSLPAKDFVKHTLNVSPIQRPSAEQSLKHPWIAAEIVELEELYRSI